MPFVASAAGFLGAFARGRTFWGRIQFVKAFKPHVAAIPRYPYAKVQAPIKLDQNESPYDLPEEVKQAALERLAALPLNRYPEMHAESLREAIADFEGWSERGVVLAPGSNVLIQTLVAAAQRVLDLEPSFPHYQLSATLTATPYQAVPLAEGFALPVDALVAAMREAETPGVLFIPNPHAPTGAFFSPDALSQLADAASTYGWLMVVDEAYYQFAPAHFKRQAQGQGHVVILRTFSKAWGLAGVRVGYLLASEEVAEVVQNLLPPFVVPATTAAILQAVLEHPGYVAEHAERIRRERERVFVELKAHPTWKAYPSHANFLLVRTPDAEVAYKELLARGVLVRRQDHYPGFEGCIRVSIGTPVENDAFLKAAFELGREGTKEDA